MAKENDYTKTPKTSVIASFRSIRSIIPSNKETIYDKGSASSDSYRNRLNALFQSKYEENNMNSTISFDKNSTMSGSKLEYLERHPHSQETTSISSRLKGQLKTSCSFGQQFTKQGSTYSYDDVALYDKGYCNSDSYKDRLNAVLQNELSETKRTTNTNIYDRRGEKQKNNDWDNIEKILIEDNPYYGQI